MKVIFGLVSWFLTIFASLTPPQILTVDFPKNPKAIANDDFCDSIQDDESRTAACSIATLQRNLFVCQNKGYPQQELYSSRVYDGICDCCDGSDEAPGTCKNICEQAYQAMREKARAEAKEKEGGLKAKAQLIAQSELAWQELKNKASAAEKERETIAQEKKQLQDRIDDKEEALKAQTEAAKALIQQKLTTGLSEFAADQLRELLVTLCKQCDQSDMYKLLDIIKPFYPEGVTADETAALFAVMPGETEDAPYDEYEEDYEAGMEQQEDASIAVETDAMGEMETADINVPTDEKPADLAQALQLQSLEASKLVEIIVKFAWEAEMCQPFIDTVCAAYKSSNACQVVSTVQCVSKDQVDDELMELKTKDKDLSARSSDANAIVREYELAQSKSWGQDNVWFAMKDTCVEFEHNKYKYHVCLFDDAKQDHTLLGTFAEIVNDSISGETTLKYTKGERCFVTKKPRTLDVHVLCGAETQLISVDEPETCAYSAVLKTPVGCV